MKFLRERIINIYVKPRFTGQLPDGKVCYDHFDPTTGIMRAVHVPVWIPDVHMIRRSMNAPTHREVFYRLFKHFGFYPAWLELYDRDGRAGENKVYHLNEARQVVDRPTPKHITHLSPYSMA